MKTRTEASQQLGPKRTRDRERSFGLMGSPETKSPARRAPRAGGAVALRLVVAYEPGRGVWACLFFRVPAFF